MSELKPCPCCGTSESVCEFTIDQSLKIVMFGCRRCAFFAENKTAWNTRASGWISVNDRLPDDGVTVLVVDNNGWMATCRRNVLINNMELEDSKYVIHTRYTHWMPLPEPPKD